MVVSKFGIPHCEQSHLVCESSRMSNTQVFNPMQSVWYHVEHSSHAMLFRVLDQVTAFPQSPHVNLGWRGPGLVSMSDDWQVITMAKYSRVHLREEVLHVDILTALDLVLTARSID